MKDFIDRHFYFIAASVALSGAYLVPQTALSAVLAWLGVLLLLRAVASAARPLGGLYLFGCLVHLLGFYWLPQTIHTFGGFPPALAAVVFVFFAALQAVQFLLLGCIQRRLSRTMAAPLALSLAWYLSEQIYLQIFPWRLAQSQAALKSFAAAAAYCGADVLSFLMLGAAELGYFAVFGVRRRKAAWLCACAALLLLIMGLGSYRVRELELEISRSAKARIALVQGNLSTEVKGDASYLQANLATYRRLSEDAVRQGAQIVIWPESVVNERTPESLGALRASRFDPDQDSRTPLLYGTLSYRERPQREYRELLSRYPQPVSPETQRQLRYMFFNSAFGIDAAGRVLGRYHKRVLMPFGEYLPLGRRYPWIQSLSPQNGDFDAGDLADPIRFPLAGAAVQSAALMPLICYEDMVPELSREGALRGAQVLVNLTNDAWYGPTHAPYQHHLLALYRAVESGRYLLRVTNTGFSAVVDPAGRTGEGLALFAEGSAVSEVPPLNETTFYTRHGTGMRIAPALLGALLFVLSFLNKRESA